MSVYDVMRGSINGAWSDDACDYDTYSELHDFIADAEYEYEKLEAENERLRDSLAESEHDKSVAWDRVRKVEADNAKLRELVRDMNKAAHMLCEAWEGSCSKEAEGMSLHEVCPIGDTSELCVFGRLDDRMRELGIEVDGYV